MTNPDFGGISFPGTLRPSQVAATSVIRPQLAEGSKELYIVAPPGSGKTILGLYVWAALVRKPTLVLSPNSAIQAQWLARTSLFDLDGKEDGLSLDPKRPGLLTSLTYQSLTMVRTKGDDLEEAGLQLWLSTLIEDGEAIDEASGLAWLEDLRVKNPDYFEKEMKKHRKKVRRQKVGEDGALAWLSEGAKASIEALKNANIGLIILDECHHLTEHWGEVLLALREELGHPIVLGLTATPPDEEKAGVIHYKELLGEIDYEVPTPALVRDSNLAPYQDLAYFVRPTPKEIAYISEADSAFLEVVDEISQPIMEKGRALCFPDWLADTLEHRRIPGREGLSYAEFHKTLPKFSDAARAYLTVKKRTLPTGVPMSSVGFGDFQDDTPLIALLRPLLDRYVRFGLLRSTHPKDQELADEVSRRLQLLGYQITSSGARPCASPVGRILAYAQGKTEALSDILRVEYEELGERLRCVIVTDFEKTSSTAVVDEVHDNEAGGAIGVFKALVECELGDQLDPVLMTGSTLLVDDDLSGRFLERARSWVSERNLSIEFRDESMGRFHHIHGSGKDWAPRYYSTMVTEFFQEGMTRCLIGTRGLLGEGWDASRINVLVDLTTVTTSMSINQLRGRSMRLDKLWPEKVANNWDIVCLAEEFIKGFDDYERFERKHKNLYGVCDDGSIEKGVGHVHAAFTELKPEAVNEGMGVINQEMLERARRRTASRDLWAIGTPFSADARKSLEFMPAQPLGGMQFQFGASGELWTEESLNRAIIEAVALGMWEVGLLPKYAKLGGGERGGGWFRYYIEECTEEQSAMFAQAISEVFGPIDGARYVISRAARFFDETFLSRLLPEVLAKYVRKERKEVVMFYRVPSCLAGKKSHASWFQKHWNKLVSPGEALYAHSKEGKEAMAFAKANGLVNQTVQHLKDVYL